MKRNRRSLTMNKIFSLTIVSTMLSCSSGMYAMEVALPQSIQLTQDRIAQFESITKQHRSFNLAVPHIKQLAEEDNDWKMILADPQATGVLLDQTYKHYPWSDAAASKINMAIGLGTDGACAWCKDYLQMPAQQGFLKRLGHGFLRAAEQDDREEMS